jgi:hypothetical protein
MAARDGIEIWIDAKGQPSAAPSSVEPDPANVLSKPKGRAVRGRLMACADGLSLKAAAGGWIFVDRK